MQTGYFLACLVPAAFFGVGELLTEPVLPAFLVLLRFRPGPDCSCNIWMKDYPIMFEIESIEDRLGW